LIIDFVVGTFVCFCLFGAVAVYLVFFVDTHQSYTEFVLPAGFFLLNKFLDCCFIGVLCIHPPKIHRCCVGWTLFVVKSILQLLFLSCFVPSTTNYTQFFLCPLGFFGK
jgi:hypothetical protein